MNGRPLIFQLESVGDKVTMQQSSLAHWLVSS